MSRASTELDVDLELLVDFPIPCSGTAHAPGIMHDPRLHGDNISAMAEWYVRWQCAYCDHHGIRPVCDFFANEVRTNQTRVVACGNCGKSNFTIDYFTVDSRI